MAFKSQKIEPVEFGDFTVMPKMTANDLQTCRIEVDQLADYLVSVFNTPESRPMYCDAVRYLTKAFIEEEIKIVLDKGIEPVRLFNHMIYKKLRLLGLYHA